MDYDRLPQELKEAYDEVDKIIENAAPGAVNTLATKFVDKSFGGEELTAVEAVLVYKSRIWKKWNYDFAAHFQLRCNRMCMDFGFFHESIEKALGRPVWTHELAYSDRLIDELEGITPKATMQDVFDKLVELADGKEIITLDISEDDDDNDESIGRIAWKGDADE